MVIDPTVHKSLHDDQRQRLDQFMLEAGLTAVESMDELKEAMEAGYPRLLYWLGHTTDDFCLLLGDEKIAPADLKSLLSEFDDRERPEGMLAFLNACQTAETRSGGSFLEALHHTFGFTGAIVTERQTIDNFANEFGLAFLQGFLREGKPLGELLHGLRLQTAPLGLLYGAHCPPDIRVRTGSDLRLMSSLKYVSDIPTEGKALIIVAAVDNVLHFRMFDGDGKMVVDTNEKSLTEQARQIADLRKQLESLWPPHELAKSENVRVIDALTSIVSAPLPIRESGPVAGVPLGTATLTAGGRGAATADLTRGVTMPVAHTLNLTEIGLA